MTIYVVYFDQLLGAARTQKMVEIHNTFKIGVLKQMLKTDMKQVKNNFKGGERHSVCFGCYHHRDCLILPLMLNGILNGS